MTAATLVVVLDPSRGLSTRIELLVFSGIWSTLLVLLVAPNPAGLGPGAGSTGSSSVSTWDTAGRMFALVTRRLRASEARFRAILRSVADPLLVLDAHGQIVEASRSAEQIFGKRANSLFGCTLDELATEDWRLAHPGRLVSTLALTQEKPQANLEMVCSRGDSKPFSCGLSVVRSQAEASDELIYVVNLHDLTERRELQRQSLHTQKMQAVAQLSSGVAHELNTPIQFIGDNLRFLGEGIEVLSELVTGYRGVLTLDAGGSRHDGEVEKLDALADQKDLEFLVGELPQALEQSLAGIERLAEVVRAMREFSRGGTLERRELDVNHLVRATTVVTESRWKRVADLELHLDPSIPTITGVSDELSQALLNLVLNACEAIADRISAQSFTRGHIEIESFSQGEWVVIKIADDGIGIAESISSRVFEPFFTTRKVGQGTGQGLSTVYDIVVDRHRGQIDFESSPGVRTIFTVRLPSKGEESTHEERGG